MKLAYTDALRMLRKGEYVLCVPGTIDDKPCVMTRSYSLPVRGVLYALHPDDDVRATFAIGVMRRARNEATEKGMSLA